jgi:hypothetical protein
MPFILRARTADGLPLYFGEAGPTITRSAAIEFNAADAEQRRAAAEDFYSLPFDAIGVGSPKDQGPMTRPL